MTDSDLESSSPNFLNKKNPSDLYRHQPKVCLPCNITNFTELSNIFKKYNISTIPVVNKTLESIIKLGKDSTNNWEQTNIVYKFNYKNCPATYIGESKRALRVCINEHKNKKNSESVVCEHQLGFNHEFDWKNTEIVDYVSNYRKRSKSEVIHIKFNKFSINKKEDIFTMKRIYYSLCNRLNS